MPGSLSKFVVTLLQPSPVVAAAMIMLTAITPLRAEPLPPVEQQLANPPASIITIETTEDVEPGGGTVSAFVIGPDLVVTALHCVDTARSANANLGPQGLAPIIEVVAVDEAHDIIVLRVRGELPPALSAIQHEPPVGSPLTLLRRTREGHGDRREGAVLTTQNLFGLSKRLVLSAEATPGFSGSPAIDDQGRWIGVVIRGGRDPARTYAYAISASVITKLIDSAAAAQPFEAWSRERNAPDRLPAIRAKQQAQRARASGNSDEAIAACHRWIEAAPSDWEAYWLGAGLTLEAKNFAAATAALDAWEKNAGHLEIMHYFRGAMAAEQDSIALAIEQFDKSIAIRPTSDAYYALAIAYLRIGKEAEGEAAIGKASELSPGLAEPFTYRAAQAYRAGRLAEATDLYRAAAERSFDEMTLLYLSICLENTGHPAEALSTLQRGVEALPRSNYLTYQLARVLGRSGRLAEAEKWIRRALDLDPHSPDATALLAYFCWKGGRHAEARTLLAAALQREPDHKELLAQMVSVCMEEKNREEAAEWLAKLRKVDPYTANRYETLMKKEPK